MDCTGLQESPWNWSEWSPNIKFNTWLLPKKISGKKFFTIRVREAVDAPSLEMLAPPLATLDEASSKLV